MCLAMYMHLLYLVAKWPPIIGSHLPSGPITYTTKVEKVMQNVCRVGVKMSFNLQCQMYTDPLGHEDSQFSRKSLGINFNLQ